VAPVIGPEGFTMSTVPEEIVPWLQPQATNDPVMVKIPALSEPATEKV
jgi:hypothetical protein